MAGTEPIPPQRISRQAYASFGLPVGFALAFNLLAAWIDQGDNLGYAYALVFIAPVVAVVFLIGSLVFSAVTRTLRAGLAGWAIAVLITTMVWM